MLGAMATDHEEFRGLCGLLQRLDNRPLHHQLVDDHIWIALGIGVHRLSKVGLGAFTCGLDLFLCWNDVAVCRGYVGPRPGMHGY